MNLAGWQRLLSPEGQHVLALAQTLQPTTATLLKCHQQLRKKYADDLVMLALETTQLRMKAKGKFTRADAMYFTREGLEQSSGELIADYRAQRYAPFAMVGDFCCGIGGDAIGLAGRTNVVAVDQDELRLAIAQANVQAYERSDRVHWHRGDLLTMAVPTVEAIFFDPDRRADGQRHVRLSEYQPSFERLRQRFSTAIPWGVKVAPAIPWNELHTFEAEKEFISVGGELKECVLWFGALQSTGRRATILPANVTIAAEIVREAAEPIRPRAYVYDPDPAVIRSGLVSHLAEMLDAQPIDADIAYLTSNQLTHTPFAQAYAVDEVLPFHAKRIGERLKALNVGHVVLTKRGSAVEVDALRRSWKLRGSETRTVILTRVLNEPYALIVRRCVDDDFTSVAAS